jgi:hypothetical protein
MSGQDDLGRSGSYPGDSEDQMSEHSMRNLRCPMTPDPDFIKGAAYITATVESMTSRSNVFHPRQLLSTPIKGTRALAIVNE